MQPKVSIIIPVYKVESFIEKCVRSLFNQTLDNLEFIFVDDCSPDKSIEVMLNVLKEFPERKKQVQVIKHEQNEGVGKTRQDGIDVASGEYIIHCDPDDWVEYNMYESLYIKAKEYDSDIVVCDFSEEWLDKSIYFSQTVNLSKCDLLNNIIYGRFHCSLCNKLIRKDFILNSEIKVSSAISLWEDMAYMIPLLLTTNKISKIDKSLYHYRKGIESSITGISLSKVKEISRIRAVEYITQALRKEGLYEKHSKALSILMLFATHGLLSSSILFDPYLWRDKNNLSTSQLFRMPVNIMKKIFYYLALSKHDKILYISLKLLNR